MCFFANLTEALENDSKRVDYQDVETRNKEDGSQQISSGAIDYFYVKSVVGCE
jgi:hypothetical protein